MLDINSDDFFDSFELSKATVGVIGHGYVGKAVAHFFNPGADDHDRPRSKVLVYDKAKPELNTLDTVVRESEVIFVAVPTPMKNDGGCYTGIIESVIQDVRQKALELGRDLDSFILVVKSTVYGGFTEKMKKLHPDMRIGFSPEFLTEKNSIKDFETTNRIVFGGDQRDAEVVFTYFNNVIPDRVSNEETLLVQTEPTVAEMAKLYANGILMTKILFSNEVYLMCQKLGCDYESVRSVATLDDRIGSSHTSVPGHDGQLGAGGHCFPKDINNLRAMCKELGVDEKIFSSVILRNLEIREDKDWLRMQGRAVIDA